MAGRTNSPGSTSSTLSNITVVTVKDPVVRSSLSASPPTSTPPTSHGDEASVLSDATKMDTLVDLQDEATPKKLRAEQQTDSQPDADKEQDSGRRTSRRSRSIATYNVQILAGTALHTPTKYLKKHHENVYRNGVAPPSPVKASPDSGKLRRNGSVKSATGAQEDLAGEQLATEAAQAARRRRSSRVGLRKELMENKLAAKANDNNTTDRNPFAIYHIIKNAIDMSLASPSQASSKRARASTAPATPQDEDSSQSVKEFVKPKTKKWEDHGLYVGQHRGFDARLTETANRNRRKLQKQENKTLPLPMYAGERLLSTDPLKLWRDYKLPFDVFSPLPRKVKPEGWNRLHKNILMGDAKAIWKNDKYQDGSFCYCTPEEGCGPWCHNRSMFYECDSNNCSLTEEQCGNRAFAELKRRSKGNRYDYGVEVVSTENRGFGVRAMRTFEPNQIIVEYAGEIITQGECDERMKKKYKHNKCYYLMSFDNKTIIDATQRGTIARFVNHSCEPNCEMIKWTVRGEPRMALFAGDRGIMTGEELTYDYNFDPFSQKNIQECKCGTASCRGVLGPKPKEPVKERASLGSSFIAGAKRKFQEVLGTAGSSKSAPSTPNKRRKFANIANSALTKAKNALAENTAIKAKAQKDAAETAAQKFSREQRAHRRSSTTSSRRTIRSKVSRMSLPASFKSKRTSLTVTRKPTKPGALRPVTKPVKLPAINRHAQESKKRNSLLGSGRTAAKTPTSKSKSKLASSPEPPSITSQSLRSSSSTSKLRQTKLPFKVLNRNSSSSPEAPDRASDSDFDVENATPRKRMKAVTPTKNATASVKKAAQRSIRGSKRTAAIAKASLRGNVRASTIRMLTGDED